MESKREHIEIVIANFRKGDNNALERYYKSWKELFVRYLHRQFPYMESDDVIEIYNDSFLAVYQNMRNGKFVNKNTAIQTYLHTIGYKMGCSHYEKNKKRIKTVDINNYTTDIADSNCDPDAQKIADEFVRNMPEPCRTILDLFYRKREKVEDISKIIGYSVGGTQNRKKRCLDTARDELKKILIEAKAKLDNIQR